MSLDEFETMVRDHARVMAAAIWRVCGRRHQALVPDVEQEVYLALWKRLQSGKKIEFPTSYIYKVALTTALAVTRKMAFSEHAVDERLAEGETGAASSLQRLAPVERARLIEEVLARLEPDGARALRAYLAGFNHREVARLYGWSESAARHRIYRSIESLAKALEAPSG